MLNIFKKLTNKWLYVIKIRKEEIDMGSKIDLKEAIKSNQKFKELILYISKQCERDDKFGATKLNKLLFYCDFEAYRQWGKSITGKEYQKLAEGPAPRCMLPVRDEMINIDKSLSISPTPFHNLKQDRFIPLREPNTKLFKKEEIELINEIIEKYRDFNGREISFESHKFIGYRIMEFNETIPYSLALIGNRPPTEKEIEYGNSLINER
ncbi:MAG: DUF4065 domain-containing protein [Candidatus Aminicenantes bacterium]|nr:DUF4065 domain-containing protein [Candidatus Aminicenantes bacterium]